MESYTNTLISIIACNQKVPQNLLDSQKNTQESIVRYPNS